MAKTKTTTTTTTTNRSKLPALIMYLIFAAALVVGLVMPLETATLSKGIDFKNMPLLQLAGALAALGLFKEIPFGAPLSATYSLKVKFGGVNFDLGAALLLAFAVAAIFALIMIIPACIAKKKADTPKKVMFTAEAICVSLLLVMALSTLGRATGNINLSVIIPLGMGLVAMAVQSVYYYRKSGVIKIILAVLSATAAFFLFALNAKNVPALYNAVDGLANKVNGRPPFDLGAGLFSVGDTQFSAANLIHLIISGEGPASSGKAFVNAVALLLLAFAGINLYLDVLGLCKRTNRFMTVSNVIRYMLQFIVIAVLAVSLLFVQGNYGIPLMLLLGLTVVTLIIEGVRNSLMKKKKVAVEDETADEDADTADSDEEYAFEPAGGEIAPAEAPVVADAADGDGADMEAHKTVTKANIIYEGPLDSFIKKLSNEEKAEFEQVFLEKSAKVPKNIPDYEVGGDNGKFFSRVMIYFSGVSAIISEGLMNKMYEEACLTN